MLIGITGKARAGKDTLASALKEKGFISYSFAYPIKEACRVIFGWNDDHLYGHLKEVVDPFYEFSPRHAMQTLGTEWGRQTLREDIWTRIAEDFLKKNKDVVIPDVRFDNEAEFILNNGGILIHLIRPNQETIGLSDHASENGISENLLRRAMEIYNDDSIEELGKRALVLVNSFDPRWFS